VFGKYNALNTSRVGYTAYFVVQRSPAKLIVTQTVKEIPSFMELEASQTCSHSLPLFRVLNQVNLLNLLNRLFILKEKRIKCSLHSVLFTCALVSISCLNSLNAYALYH
jgi:hypothetical protein